MNITPAGLQLLFQNIQLNFQQAYAAAQTTYEQWTTPVPSKTREEHYGWMDRLPMVREWVGERVLQNVVAQEYTLKNKKWELTEAVKREDIEDEQLALYSMTPQMMGVQTKVHPDELAIQVLEAGTSINTFDNTPFFSASHPVDTYNAGRTAPGGSTTQSNYFTAATSGAMPLNAANVGTGRANMRKLAGRDGKRLGINPTHLMVGPANEQAAMQIAKAQFIAPAAAFGQNTTQVQTNVLQGTLQVIVNERLTSDSAWYLMDLSKPIKPLVFQDRMPMEFTFMVNPNDPNVWELDQYEYGTRARYNVGYALWFLIAKFDTV